MGLRTENVVCTVGFQMPFVHLLKPTMQFLEQLALYRKRSITMLVCLSLAQ